MQGLPTVRQGSDFHRYLQVRGISRLFLQPGPAGMGAAAEGSGLEEQPREMFPHG